MVVVSNSARKKMLVLSVFSAFFGAKLTNLNNFDSSVEHTWSARILHVDHCFSTFFVPFFVILFFLYLLSRDNFAHDTPVHY